MAYVNLRQKENRIHSDEIVKSLPNFDDHHPNKKEWEMRKSTLLKLMKILPKNKPKSVLELGSGNCWLSYNLAKSLDAEICALDVNKTELQQGARVFGSQQNLSFVYADILSPVLKDMVFDAIILGASMQYFQRLENLLTSLLQHTTPSGSIYIADSPVYQSPASASAAKKRSIEYFGSQGFPEMADQYFHHTFEDLKKFSHKILYDPKSIISLWERKVLGRSLSVFPIICIRNKN
jgi:ubiquinone/menaquinone biosynthesis C-methylase UbiE